jgi:hypothetical protein
MLIWLPSCGGALALARPPDHQLQSRGNDCDPAYHRDACLSAVVVEDLPPDAGLADRDCEGYLRTTVTPTT